MKIGKLGIAVVTGLTLVAGGLTLFLNFDKPLFADATSNVNSTPPIAQVETNKVLRGTWDLTVTGVKFYTGHFDSDKKAASVELTFTNNAGIDKPFLPKGNIIALVGNSGKIYDLDMNHPIDKMYTASEQSRKSDAKQLAQPFHPGIFKLVPSLDVDATEQNFSKIVYMDENGNKVEVPIEGITPEIVKPNPDAK